MSEIESLQKAVWAANKNESVAREEKTTERNRRIAIIDEAMRVEGYDERIKSTGEIALDARKALEVEKERIALVRALAARCLWGRLWLNGADQDMDLPPH